MARIKTSLLLLTIGYLFSTGLWAQDTILIFHPTVSNIKTIITLSDGIMFTENEQHFHFLGVYHTSEQYDYKQSEQYLREHEDAAKFFSIRAISDSLKPDFLFRINSCTYKFQQLFNSSIGAVFLGGPDIPPGIYNEPVHLLTSVTDPFRHYLEVSALFHLLGSSVNPDFRPFLEEDTNYVVLGICLGMQTMNVATGGTLIQDIPMEVYGCSSREAILNNPAGLHRNYYFDDPGDDIHLTGYHFHPIILTENSSFSSKLKLSNKNHPYVLSSHHQAIQYIGKGLIPVAYSIDGKIIEAVEHEKYPAVTGVQFHPEKTELFYNSYLHVTTDSTINYKAFIESNKSDTFHNHFWKMIGKLFIENRKTE